MPYVGRLAPSPTGALHLGNVRTFMVAWLRARSQGGKVILRMEDLDHPKDKPGAAAAAIEDLKWLGFDWDEEFVQSERKHLYRAALESLAQPSTNNHQPSTFVYPCVCSRKDVEAAQSAPHAGEQLFYPGTCRGRFRSWREAYGFLKNERLPCWRFAVEPGTKVEFEDAFAGPFRQDVSATLGDFPIARDEFGAGYTLAVVVDDLLMGVTEVVRGDDLLPATPAQILLARALLSHPTYLFPPPSSLLPPTYCHLPLVVGPDGKRLAKRHGDTRVSTYRAAGRRPEEILGFLAASCGWCERGEAISLKGLLPRFRLETIPHRPFVIDDKTRNLI